MINLFNRFKEEVAPQLRKAVGINNVMATPALVSITIHATGGRFIQKKQLLEEMCKDIELISGQKAITCLAHKSIAQWKIRKGFALGAKTTLHRHKMYNFIEKFINIVVPRIADFRGFSKKAFDQQGNYHIGIKDHTCFPEISHDTIEAVRGLNINITTNTSSIENSIALLEHLGFPFNA